MGRLAGLTADSTRDSELHPFVDRVREPLRTPCAIALGVRLILFPRRPGWRTTLPSECPRKRVDLALPGRIASLQGPLDIREGSYEFTTEV
jgi:hypothetical protein